jgi:hypothetical protein
MRRADALGTGALLVLVGKIAHGMPHVRDLPTADEGSYEANGLRLLWGLLGHGRAPRPPADWAPLYSTWVAAVGAFCRDPAWLFDVNWTLLVGICTVTLFLLARRLRQPVVASVVVAAAPLATGFFQIEPFPSLLFLAMVLLACLAASASASAQTRASVMAAAFGGAAFVRPEAALGYVVCLGALALELARSRPRRHLARSASSLLLALGVPAVLAVAFGDPLAGGRSFVAFSQHYAFTLTRREHLSGDPWMNYSGLVRRDFGESTTILQALAANPGALLAHTLYNLRELPSNVLDLCAVRTNAMRPASAPVQAASAVVLVASVVALVARLRRVPRALPLPDVVVASAFALACACAAPGVLLVFPRAHYLVASCGLGWLLAGAAMSEALRQRLPPWIPSSSVAARALGAVATAVGLWLLVPDPARSAPEPQPVRRAAAWLRSLELPDTPVFSAGVDLAAFAGVGGPFVAGWTKSEPLLDVFAREHIAVATLEERVLGREAYVDDPQVRAFLSDPAAHGFCEAYRDPGFIRIFVRADALPPGRRAGVCGDSPN